MDITQTWRITAIFPWRSWTWLSNVSQHFSIIVLEFLNCLAVIVLVSYKQVSYKRKICKVWFDFTMMVYSIPFLEEEKLEVFIWSLTWKILACKELIIWTFMLGPNHLWKAPNSDHTGTIWMHLLFLSQETNRLSQHWNLSNTIRYWPFSE